jgi:RNA polymerase sigma factor (sigma-70 family)
MKKPPVNYNNLTYVELQKVLATCEGLHSADPAESFVAHCQQVMETVLSHVHFSAERQQIDPFMMLEKPNNTVDEHYLPLYFEHVQDHPFLQRLLTAPESEVGMIQIEPTVRKYRNSALYNEFYDQVEAQNQIWNSIVSNNELLIFAYSQEKEYTDNQYAMLHIIQPHLELAWSHWQQTQSLKEELKILKDSIFLSEEQEAAAARLRRAIDTLTPRQQDVVERVASGLDNQQIADELGISKRTVQKHLELIFQSMAVQHRTELTAKWHQAHSVQLY